MMRFAMVLTAILMMLFSSAPVNSESPPMIAADKAGPGHIVFAELNADVEKEVMGALLSGQTLPFIPAVKEVYSDKADFEAWEGNRPELKAELKRIIVCFRRPSSLRTEPEGIESFDVILEFQPKDLIARISHPRQRRYRGGMRLAFSQPWGVFLEGVKDTSVAVLTAQSVPEEEQRRALLLCPRSRREFRSEGKVQNWLMDSGYRFSRGLFSVSAAVEGRALSGGNIGLARGSILTSPNISRAEEYFDQVYMRDPRISLNYRPYVGEIVAAQAESRGITAGVEVRIEFQRSSGHKRLSTLRDVVWIKEVAMEQGQEWWAVGPDRTQVPVAGGICYLVLKEKTAEHRFSREPFELPARLKGTA